MKIRASSIYSAPENAHENAQVEPKVNFTGLDQHQRDRTNLLPKKLPYSWPEPMKLILWLHLRIVIGTLGRTL